MARQSYLTSDPYTCSLDNAISDAYSEIEELASEMVSGAITSRRSCLTPTSIVVSVMQPKPLRGRKCLTTRIP